VRAVDLRGYSADIRATDGQLTHCKRTDAEALFPRTLCSEAVANGRVGSTATHAYGEPPQNPSPRTREHPKYWFADHFTVGQIEAIADEIADINGDLLSLYCGISPYSWFGE
jgi:hypothetical protein